MAGKGQPRTGGRKKGTPNRWTRGVKAALHEAFDQLGGVESLVNWARKNRADFYRLWAKTLPREVKAELTGADGGPLNLNIHVPIADRIDQLERLLAAGAGGAAGDGAGEPLRPGGGEDGRPGGGQAGSDGQAS